MVYKVQCTNCYGLSEIDEVLWFSHKPVCVCCYADGSGKETNDIKDKQNEGNSK